MYKLQVVEACSGLRYLYPLLSLGFLAAYLFHAPFWQRALVFFSAIPITIVMNSFRIGLMGVWSIAGAPRRPTASSISSRAGSSSSHAPRSSGGRNLLLARFAAGKGFFEVFRLPKVSANVVRPPNGTSVVRAPIAACLVLLCSAGMAVLFLSGREEIVPERARFVGFPASLGQWQGPPSLMEPQVEHFLGLEDYILSDYNKPNEGRSTSMSHTTPHSEKAHLLIRRLFAFRAAGGRSRNSNGQASTTMFSRVRFLSTESSSRRTRANSSSIIGSFSAAGTSPMNTGRSGTYWSTL